MKSIRTLLLAALLGMAPLTSDVQSNMQNNQNARLKILVGHGPNLNLLGRREPNIYGVTTLPQINEQLQKLAAELNVELIIVQSNHEGVIVDTFQQHIDDVAGAIITPAARASIMGLGWRSYTAGLRALVEIVREEKAVKEGSRK